MNSPQSRKGPAIFPDGLNPRKMSGWTTPFPRARLGQAMLERLRAQAHSMDTGSAWYRFRRSWDKQTGKGGKA